MRIRSRQIGGPDAPSPRGGRTIVREALACSQPTGWESLKALAGGQKPQSVIPDSAPPICPSWQGALAKRPKAKTRYPRCGAFIYVRSVPEGGQLLVKDADLPAIQARWTQHAARSQASWAYAPVVGESHRNDDGSAPRCAWCPSPRTRTTGMP